MGPCLRPVFPGVSAGVSRDERICPVDWRALLVMAFERLAVILPLVAEETAKLDNLIAPMDQPVPEVMSDLMSEMAQECPVRFVHLKSPRLALGIVGLGHVDSDNSVQVPGRCRDCPRHAGVEVGKEVERQTALRVLGLARQG